MSPDYSISGMNDNVRKYNINYRRLHYRVKKVLEKMGIGKIDDLNYREVRKELDKDRLYSRYLKNERYLYRMGKRIRKKIAQVGLIPKDQAEPKKGE